MITRTLAHLLSTQAAQDAERPAVTCGAETLTYGSLEAACMQAANGMWQLGIEPGDRVAIYLGKTIQNVVAMFGAAFARAVFVPINPVLKGPQVQHILNDCGATMLITSASRVRSIETALPETSTLRQIVLTDQSAEQLPQALMWDDMLSCNTSGAQVAGQEADVASILYTSGSTGKPKGVVLSQANMTIGGLSVASYIGNTPQDRILSLLPLSFDAGFSQISTAFASGAHLHLLDYLLAQDVVRTISTQKITGITGVPPLWHQLASAKWGDGDAASVRYFANTGGKMPRPLLSRLRETFPNAKPFLMYGLTEAFRSTYLDPELVDAKPDSIGKAIPNAEISVINTAGEFCQPGEPGELVHSGPLVAMGYWNDTERTAERFKPSPLNLDGLPQPPMAVWSGDQVTLDEEGYLYFVGREDEMIKSSGYRISPAEVEEAILACAGVDEVAAFGVPDEKLGQAVAVYLVGSTAEDALRKTLRASIPPYMVPTYIYSLEEMPKNPNGKIDRSALKKQLETEH